MKYKVIGFLARLLLLVVGIACLVYGIKDAAQFLHERHPIVRSIEN